MQQPAFFMLFMDNDQYFGNFELFEEPKVTFLAANDTPEELWPRVEQWLESEIYGTDKVVLSYFESPFEKRVLQLLLERNHPRILFTYPSTNRDSFRELNVSRTNPNSLVLSYRPASHHWPSEQLDRLRMAVVNISDEFISIGATADSNLLTILDLYRQSPKKPHRML